MLCLSTVLYCEVENVLSCKLLELINSVVFKRELTVSVYFYEGIATSKNVGHV